MRKYCRQFVWLATAAMFVAPVTCMAAAAQAAGDHDVAVVGDAGQNLDDHKPPTGVALPDSPAAVDLLKRAARQEAQKNWETAVGLYQQGLAQSPQRVVLIARGGNQQTQYYSGIAPIVQERLAKWPDDAVELYQSIYEQTADNLLAGVLTSGRAHEAAPLSNIFWNYFATDAAKTAGIGLIDLYLERGNFSAAEWIGNRLLTLHPHLTDSRSEVLYLTAAAYHFQSDDAHARDLQQQLRQTDPDATAVVGGQQMRLSDALAALLASPAPLPTTRPSYADTYPQMGGLGGRGEISGSQAKLSTGKLSVSFTPPDYTGVSAAQAAALQAADRASAEPSLANAIIPVVDNGDLFFQDGRSIYAIDSATAAALPGWTKTYPGESQGRYHLHAFGKARGELLTVTVSPKVVLAVVGQRDSLAATVDVGKGRIGEKSGSVSVSATRLVCLDRNTGRELWVKTPVELTNAAAALRGGEYEGSPVVIPGCLSGTGASGASDDSIVITARTGRLNQFDECYLVCLSLKSGEYLWSTYLGGASHDIRMKNDVSPISFAEGRIFTTTNLGATAAIDPADGKILWLNTYPHNTDNLTGHALLGFGQARSSLAWQQNPVIVQEGMVFVLPSDSASGFVYDADSGAELAHFPTADWDHARVLLAVRGGEMLLNSESKLFAVDWRHFSSTGNAAESTAWAADLSFIDNSSTCGHGFVTQDSVWIPTTHRILQIKRGRIRFTYPAKGRLTLDQQPGSMLATANLIVVAGQSEVDIYRRLSAAKSVIKPAQ